jgi:hypothetical protein
MSRVWTDEDREPGRTEHGRALQALPRVSLACDQTALFRAWSARQHGHKPKHVILDKMGQDAADHEVDPRFWKRHDFLAVEGVEARVQPPIKAVRRIVNQGHPRRRAGGRGGLLDINVLRARPVVIDDDLTQATDNKVDRAPGWDGHVRRDQLVAVPRGCGDIREPTHRGVRVPRAKADRGIGQAALQGHGHRRGTPQAQQGDKAGEDQGGRLIGSPFVGTQGTRAADGVSKRLCGEDTAAYQGACARV